MVHPCNDDSSRYLKDIVNISLALDEVIRRNDARRLQRALSRGKEDYFDLVFRRLSVDFVPRDTAVVLWLLDLIQAKLATLAQLQHERSLLPEAQDEPEEDAFAGNGPMERRSA